MTDDLDELERRVLAGKRLVEQHGAYQPEQANALIRIGEVLALLSRCRAAERERDEARAALAGLLGNKHINLGDMIYHVREAEGLGWEGPSVTAWSHAVMQAQTLLKAAAKETARLATERREGESKRRTDTCAHQFEANPGMYDSLLRYCIKCGIVEGAKDGG